MVLELVAVVLAFLCGWCLHAYRTLQTQVASQPSEAPERQRRAHVARPGSHCYQVTFGYSDGSTQTFRNCEGFHDFTQNFGRSQAPVGATLVSRAGEACDAH